MRPPASHHLLTRDEFRTAVLIRDGYRCVLCGAPAVDAHHIIERRLWSDGGYYVANGASVCPEHHLACERTTVSTDQVRTAAGITTVVVPPHLTGIDEGALTKWGDVELPDGRRLPGELFHDPSVRKVLVEGGVLERYVRRYRYPRTPHVAWSPGRADDDITADLSVLEAAVEVVVTEKRDGECTTIGPDYLHARSPDGRAHPSQAWVRRLQGEIGHDIPEGWRVVGENLFGQHSIRYDGLDTYFEAFSVWDGANRCLGWDESLEWLELLGLVHVPVLYEGLFDPGVVHDAWMRATEGRESEGWVVRTREGFDYRDFRTHVAKWVHEDFAAGRHGWRSRAVVPNGLR